MIDIRSAEVYEQIQARLRDLETRLADLEHRTDLDPEQRATGRRSYQALMRELLRDIKRYEARKTQ